MVTTSRQHHVRVSEEGHRLLRELAESSGDPMTAVLDRAIEQYWRAQLFEEAGRQWTAIQADPTARADIEAEYAVWDVTVADGLERDEW
jgi:hypothetical protein